jgi:hypothetical protein
VAVGALAALAVPRAALACPVCFGQSDSPLALAMNLGIFVMLGVVVAVLVSFAAFFIRLARGEQRLTGSTVPPGADRLAHTIHSHSDPQEGTAQC